jgi:hypothetical protein
VFPIPQIKGVKVSKNDAMAAVLSTKIEYENWVIENTKSKPPSKVNKPIEFPNREKIRTYKAQEAVNELVKSPVFAISTAANESPEKNPGKKIIQETSRTRVFRSKENLISVFLKLLIISSADE